MKKLLALLASLAVCCTMFAACADEGRASSAAESSSIADTTAADSSTADTTAAESSSEADSPDTSSEADTSSADEQAAPTAPSFTEIRENEKVAETVDFDPAPFDLLDSLAHSEHHTFSYTETKSADLRITSTYTEVLDGENAYASKDLERVSDNEVNSYKQAYLLLDGKSYFIDYDNEAYFEEKETKTVQQVIYAFSRDLESLSDWLNEGCSSAIVCKATLFGEDCLKYSFVLDEENVALYAKNGVPTYITDSYADDEEDNAAITYNRLEATADPELLKIPDGFKQLTQDEYYDLYGQYD